MQNVLQIFSLAKLFLAIVPKEKENKKKKRMFRGSHDKNCLTY